MAKAKTIEKTTDQQLREIIVGILTVASAIVPV
jgi:hypothetical protein